MRVSQYTLCTDVTWTIFMIFFSHALLSDHFVGYIGQMGDLAHQKHFLSSFGKTYRMYGSFLSPIPFVFSVFINGFGLFRSRRLM